MQPPPPDGNQSAFEAETVRFREVLAKGRSANQLALFDLLVERSRDQRSPKEIEIAIALFGNAATLNANSNSGVRVYVHRLRKRIDEYYHDKSGPRLVIPKGEYRVVLTGSDDLSEPHTAAVRWGQRLMLNPALSLGLLLIACGTLAFAVWHFWSTTSAGTSRTTVDRQALFDASAEPFAPLIAVGDSMLLAETQDQHSIQRMILNPAVQTREDFGNYLKEHPKSFYQLYDFNLHFAPVAAVETAWAVQGALAPPNGKIAPNITVTPVSSLSTEQLDTRDIIFVGRLSQLGILAPQVFAQSRFRLAGYDRLVDTTDGKLFQGQVYTNEQTGAQKDYGYFAVRSSSSGQRLIIIAGLGDKGTSTIATLLNTPQEIIRLKRKVRAARHFEALFEIQSHSGAPLQRRLIATHILP